MERVGLELEMVSSEHTLLIFGLEVYSLLYQPYVVLQKGNAVAEESLLLDYVCLSSTSEMTRVDLGTRSR